jgi:hypothetical protein
MAEERITLIVRDAMVDCRRDQLWTRLMTGSPPLSYSEFVHLTTLVQHETLDEVRGPTIVVMVNCTTILSLEKTGACMEESEEQCTVVFVLIVTEGS